MRRPVGCGSDFGFRLASFALGRKMTEAVIERFDIDEVSNGVDHVRG